MTILVGTHSGPFHADDVLAFAMIREFVDPRAAIVRTRDSEKLDEADMLIDVGGVYAPQEGRFDHHQASYQGELSSAGMILEWLHAEKKVGELVARALREQLVDYVDAVDNGRRKATPQVPCYSSVIATIAESAIAPDAHDRLYLQAVALTRQYIQGIVRGIERAEAARAEVVSAMEAAVRAGRRVIYLDQYLKWKPAYFEHGGVDHPTDYVLFPAEGRWRILAIPVDRDCIQNKRSLPEQWAGLTDEALSEVIGVPGARFCHKNRFIAVFDTREGALDALKRWGLHDASGAPAV